MGWRTGKQHGRSREPRWSGEESPHESPRHRWQDANAADTYRYRRRGKRNRWVFSAALGVGLLVALIVVWLMRYRQTPLICITVTEYEAPLPLNPWAYEDEQFLTKISQLDHERVEWKKGQPQFDLFPRGFNSGDTRTPLIVYINAHGVVTQDPETKRYAPCILLPGGSIDDPKGFRTVGSILDELQKKVNGRNTLVILDCNRIRTNWSLGIIYNTFVERLRQVVEEKHKNRDFQNLAVLTAAGPGQVNWPSADLQGSAFGHFLQLGLAGEADEKGDGDDWVSLRELADYLRHEVSRWSSFNRGEPQDPLLIAAEKVDFRLKPIGKSPSKEPVDEPGREQFEIIGTLWKQVDDLRRLELVRLDPLAWRNFEHQVLRLEEMMLAGQAYEENVATERDRLKGVATSIGAAVKEGTKARQSHSIVAYAPWVAGIAQGSPLPTLPCCEYFGIIAPDKSKLIEGYWAALAKPSASAAAGKDLDTPAVPRLADELAETQFRAAMRARDVNSLWQSVTDFKLAEAQELRKTAEELAVPRAASGMPGDERAHYYVRFAAMKADAARRLAEDLLFVGPIAKQQCKIKVAEATNDRRTASDDMDKASTAFRVRDEALAELPYLAEWACNPLLIHSRASDAELKALEQIRDEIVRLVPSLDQKVNVPSIPLTGNPLPAGNESLRELVDAFDEVQYRLTELKRQLFGRIHIQVVEDQPTKGKTEAAGKAATNIALHGVNDWRAAEAALQTPLILADQRQTLLWQRALVAFKQNQEEANQPPGKSLLISAEIVHGWKNHPLLKILESGAATSTGNDHLAWCETSADQVRQLLKNPVVADSGSEASAGPGSNDDALIRTREVLSRAETSLRRTAPFIFYDSKTCTEADNPVARLRRFDLEQLLIWHGRRAIADFWWDEAETPFFARAAKSCFAAATNLNKPVIRAVREQIRAAETDLQNKMNIVPLTLSASSKAGRETNAPTAVSVTVTPDRAMNFTTGDAALFLGADTESSAARAGRFSGTTEPFAKLSAEAPPEQKFTANVESAEMKSLTVTAFFRGRELSRLVPLSRFDSVTVDYSPVRRPWPTITLIGDRTQRTAFVFVFDCSGSMGEILAGDTRMALAKDSIKSVLDELYKRNQGSEEIWVGAWFFGHRAQYKDGYRKDAVCQPDDKIRKWADFSHEFKEPRLMPDNDVERVLDIGRFPLADKVKLIQKVDEVKPWGETPLYLALAQAASDLGQRIRDSNVKKTIIAITDGMNTGKNITWSDVVTAARRVDVQINILGFDLPDAPDEFKDIATQTGGKYETARNADELLTALQEQLSSAAYEVTGPKTGAGSRFEQHAALRDSVEIRGVSLPNEFTVRFPLTNTEQKVWLEGSEGAVLQLADRSPTYMYCKPYEEAKPYPLSGGEPLSLRVHPTMKSSEGTRKFQISLQIPLRDDEYRFTRQPAESWLEVTPVTSDPDQLPYVFYDVNCMPGKPVPVMEWTASNWPAEATQARLRYWCKPDGKTTKAASIRLGNWKGEKTVPNGKLSLEVKEEGNSICVCIEEHHQGGTPFASIRVGLGKELNELVSRVVHQFRHSKDASHVTHFFYFPADSREEVMNGTIEVAKAEDVKSGALHVQDPIIVPVNGSPTYHSLDETSASR
jgi:hypothetical protein